MKKNRGRVIGSCISMSYMHKMFKSLNIKLLSAAADRNNRLFRVNNRLFIMLNELKSNLLL